MLFFLMDSCGIARRFHPFSHAAKAVKLGAIGFDSSNNPPTPRKVRFGRERERWLRRIQWTIFFVFLTILHGPYSY